MPSSEPRSTDPVPAVRRHTAALGILVSPLLGVLLTLLLAGCGGGAQEARPAPTQRKVQKTYKEIYLLRSGSRATDRHMGFLGESYIAQADGSEEVAFEVYDTGFNSLGFFFEDGTTYQFEGTDPERIGRFEVQRAFEVLYDQSGTYDIRELRDRPVAR